MNRAGIYIITNIENNKAYVGSTIDFKRRWWEHRSGLRRGVHRNPHLQVAWDKCGEGAFEFGILEYLDNQEELCLAEQFWMDVYREEGVELYNCGPVAHYPERASPRSHPAFVHRHTNEVILAGQDFRAVCQEHGLDPRAMNRVRLYEQVYHKGWMLLKRRDGRLNVERLTQRYLAVLEFVKSLR